ncbi:MAG: nucleotidyltransferase domain-containing protein [Nanobdellota archaeon]
MKTSRSFKTLPTQSRESSRLNTARDEQSIVCIPLKQILAGITPFATAAVFGSYAEGSQTQRSDLDIVILSNSSTKSIKATLNRTKILVPMDAHVFTPGQFVAMLEKGEFWKTNTQEPQDCA